MKISPKTVMLRSALCCVGSFASLLACSGGAHADLKWTETMKISGGQIPQGGPPLSISTTNMARGEWRKSETTITIGPIKMGNAELTHCGDTERKLYDTSLKLWAKSPAETYKNPFGAIPSGGLVGMGALMGQPGMGKPAPPPAEKETGTAKIEFAVHKLEDATIAGIKSSHYSVDVTTTSTGCAGDGTQKMTMEVWTAPIALPAPCLATSFEDTIKGAMRTKSSCDVKTEMVGDVEALKAVFNNFQMKIKVNNGQNMSFEKEVTMLSQAELKDEEFVLPTDWKEVSESTLQMARSQAMMKAMMAGMADGGDEGDN